VKRSLLWMAGLLAFVAALWAGWTFRSGNAGQIDLDLIWIRLPGLEIWWVVLVTLAMGVLVASLPMSFVWLRMRLLVHRYRRTIRRLEKEVHELRSLPLHAAEPDASEFALAEPVPRSAGTAVKRG
jgi:uncharacterized membrane protein YciS (DUF1049 family)